MKKKIGITILIPVFQARENIGNIIKALLQQKGKGIVIEKIHIHSDGSTDGSDEIIKMMQKMKDSKIEFSSSTKNKGHLKTMTQLFKRGISDVTVILNDDIRIISDRTIYNLVSPLIKDRRINLVNGNPIAMRPKSFVGKSVYSSYLVFNTLRHKYKEGKSKLTVEGKIMALRKNLAKKINLKNSPTGNVDIFIYFENIRLGGHYAFAKNARVDYRLPETIRDYWNQENRTQSARALLRRSYGSIVDDEWRIPLRDYVRAILPVFMKYPIEALYFKFVIKLYHKLKIRNRKNWVLALSTKKL